jgi:serine/threonine-protein kinase RsbT
MSAELKIQIRTDLDATRAALESTRFAREAGFEETPTRMIATAVSELARNILKYARTGYVYLRPVQEMRRRGIEVEATDRGPGIRDVEGAMQDHVSTSGTLGLGLPGVRRLMDEFSLESAPGKGTRVTAIKWL